MKVDQAETAIENYRFHILPHASAEHLRILDIMKQFPGKDFTIAELAVLLNNDKSSVSGRRREMLDARLIANGPMRNCRITGIMVQTVKLIKGE